MYFNYLNSCVNEGFWIKMGSSEEREQYMSPGFEKKKI